MGEFNLIKIEGKPLEKLIDVISKGVGTIYKPRAIRKEADAKAYEIEIIERAKSKALAEGKEIDFEVLDKIHERLLFKEIKRQKNIDIVSQIAAEQILQETEVSDEPVNDDWSTRFFNIIEDISDEEIQKLWGRVLAGEVKKPQSFSIRTLELLKNLNKDEAALFMKVTELVVSSHGSPFLYRGEDSKHLENYTITFNDRLLLIELGLLQSDINITRNFYEKDIDEEVYFEAGNILFKAWMKAKSAEINLPIFRFSKIGEELLKLTGNSINSEYVNTFGQELKNRGFEVEYVYILEKKSDTYHFDEPWIKV
jgi:DNA-dependent RNA polymerase auxiliary subunit epsilon